jgi:Type IX secretion system protein PorV
MPKHMANVPFMFRCLLLAVLLLVAGGAQAQLFPNLGGQRVGISALPFLKNDLSPKSTGMGGANATLKGDAFGATINPAQAAEQRGFTVGVSNLLYGGGLNHSLVTGILPLNANGNLYSNVHMLSMGQEKVRTEFAPNGTGEYFLAYSLAAEVGYAQNLSEQFSMGVGLKYIREQLAEFSANGIAADIGFLYRTDWRNLRFGAALQNFGTNSTLKGSYNPNLLQNGTTTSTEGYPAPTLFKMGASFDAYAKDDHLITAHLQLNHPNDNAENIRIGGEYIWSKTLMLRAGVKLGVANERVPTAGIGYRFSFGGQLLQMDYAANKTQYLGWMHSLGLSFSIAKADAAAADVTTNPIQ